MKRNFSLLVLLPLLLAGAATNTWSQNPAATNNEREVAEDNYKRLSAGITQLEANQALQQQQISALEKAVRDLREEVARANNNAATQESLRRLAEQIQKVDEARVTENKKIHDTLDELHRLLKAAAVGPPPTRPGPSLPPAAGAGTTSEEGFDYVVQKGDTLSGIVQAYRTQNIKVTSKAIKDANPTVVNWDRLSVGRKIFIPKPKG